MSWLFGILIYLYAYLCKPRHRGEGLGLPTGQGTLPSLRTGGVGGKGVEEKEGSRRRGGSGNFDWYYLESN